MFWQISVISTPYVEDSVPESTTASLPQEGTLASAEEEPAQALEAAVSCEKADLERHEKESPSSEDITSVFLTSSSKTENEITNSKLISGSCCGKLSKTHENNAVAASSSGTESHIKLNKTNENNAVIASCSSLMVSAVEMEFLPTKADKTNENNFMAAGAELNTSSCSTSSSCGEENRKSISATENLSLQQSEQQQNMELTRHMSITNCDHKTNLNIANTMFIQAEKSNNKSKNSSSILKNNGVSPLNDKSLTLSKQNPNCEYRVRCYRFRNFLGLPGTWIWIC